MPALQYSSSKVSLIFGGKLISGWADGDFVTVSMASDFWTLAMGSDGVGTRSCTRDLSATVQITLMASSPSNDYLSACFLADRQSGAGVLPFLMRDTGGSTLASAETMWITKTPDVSFSRAVSQRVWAFTTDSMNLIVSGNVAV